MEAGDAKTKSNRILAAAGEGAGFSLAFVESIVSAFASVNDELNTLKK